MSESVLLPLGEAGLVKADLGLRFYVDGVSTPALLADVTVTEVEPEVYLVAGLPAGTIGTWRTLTWEHPAGVGGAHVYPRPQPASPPNVVLPVREGGLSAGDLNLALYRNGALRGDALTATEVGGTGDYRVAGWPTTLGGDWVLTWSRSGLNFVWSWTSTQSAGTSARYLSILSVQRPFPIGLDDHQRPMFSVNFEGLADAPVDQWEENLVAILATAGLATSGTDTFIGPAVAVPTGNGPYITVLDSGGTAPIQAHGPTGSLYERLSAQIVVRAKSYTVARTRALAVWRALHGVRNQTVAA